MIKTYLRVLEDGQHIIEKQETFNSRLKNLEPCLYVVTIDKAKNKRSILQNGYYWSVVLGAFCDGYLDTNGEEISKEEAHETLKMELNYKTISNEETGEVVRVPRSTADINTKEFAEYVEKCRRFIGEWFGVETPDPDPSYKVKINHRYSGDYKNCKKNTNKIVKSKNISCNIVTMKRRPTYTPLGLWYTRQPRVMRKKFLADAYERGLSPGRVRTWMYFNIVPTMENMKIVEELTGIKYEQLFPY